LAWLIERDAGLFDCMELFLPREDTQQFDIYAFGETLIKTEDLDPAYVGLYKAHLPEPQLIRLFVSYLLFYNLGLAAWLSEQENYWSAVENAAINVEPSPLGLRWPRGTERRHFRGDKAVSAVRTLAKSSPESLYAPLKKARWLAAVATIVGSWPMCGPWASFKAADLLQCVADIPIRFPVDTCLMYKEPRAGLEMLAADACFEAKDRSLESIYRKLIEHFQQHKTPPSYGRCCGPAEC
jgi:hypothetical protein